VLEGTIVMQVKGGKQPTLMHGQAVYEGPEGMHVVTPSALAVCVAMTLISQDEFQLAAGHQLLMGQTGICD